MAIWTAMATKSEFPAVEKASVFQMQMMVSSYLTLMFFLFLETGDKNDVRCFHMVSPLRLRDKFRRGTQTQGSVFVPDPAQSPFFKLYIRYFHPAAMIEQHQSKPSKIVEL
jgi:hypothetical protein